jgi:hypothetical protein
MNSYNDNLHASVVNTLQTLDLAKKTQKSNLDSAIFSLYYAEGAVITASEKLNQANDKYKKQQNISAQAIANANIAVNLSAAAAQQKTYTAQSVTNAAVSASNIQIASNAIVRLAGDVGNIYTILRAADAEGELHDQGELAYALINSTAYDAEKLSQASMEASTYTAEVSSDTVADEAAATNTAIANLLAVTNADFNAIADTVTADHAALADASTVERVAEGTLESSNAEYFAVQSAYSLNSRYLNLGLNVSNKNYAKYTVNFTYYRAPFKVAKKVGGTATDNLAVPDNLTTADSAATTSSPMPKEVNMYPVNEYYIMLVKDSKKQVFTISNAESLYNSKQQSKKVTLPTDPKTPIIQTEILIDDLNDSDGDKMVLGAKYAVFVFARLKEDYKKLINTFDDYLSAPSESFALTVDLESPKSKDILEKDNGISFIAAQPSVVQAKFVEHRIMYLPDNKGLITGLLSQQGLRSIENEMLRLEIIADKYDPLITQLESELLTISAQLSAAELNTANTAPTAAPAEESPSVNQLKSDYTEVRKKLDSERAKMQKEMNAVKTATQSQPGFFFNVKIAEQVSFANYTKAGALKDKEKAKPNEFFAEITETTTDNFGDALIDGATYIPVVLTVVNVPAEDLSQYKNSLSDYASTKPFKYKAAKPSSENPKK